MDGKWIFEDKDGNDLDIPIIKLSDGRKSTNYAGCDWKENPADCYKQLMDEDFNNQTHEIVEFEDGSDAFWFVVVKRKRA